MLPPTPPLTPPPAIVARLSDVKQINRFTSLPAGIQAGSFTVDGVSATGWRMAEPGGIFSATDEPIPGAPGRRLIFAACDPKVCLIHYELGGVEHIYEILGLSRGAHGWTVIWNARGNKPVDNLDALRALLQHRTPSRSWTQQWVKGDF